MFFVRFHKVATFKKGFLSRLLLSSLHLAAAEAFFPFICNKLALLYEKNVVFTTFCFIFFWSQKPPKRKSGERKIKRSLTTTQIINNKQGTVHCCCLVLNLPCRTQTQLAKTDKTLKEKDCDAKLQRELNRQQKTIIVGVSLGDFCCCHCCLCFQTPYGFRVRGSEGHLKKDCVLYTPSNLWIHRSCAISLLLFFCHLFLSTR